MTLKQATIGVALSMVLAGTANAATTWMGIQGGAGIPTGDYGDVATTGWHLGVTGTHWMNTTWGFGGDIAYHAWSASDDVNAAAEAAFGPGSEFHWSAMQATAHAKANLPMQSQTHPYATFGVGMYNITSKLSSPSGDADASKSKLGFNLGAGMTMPGTGTTRWGFDALYHVVPASDDFGSDLNFFTVGANVMWGMSGTK